MAKILVRLMTFMIIIAGLTMLTFISSCVTSTSSHQDGGKMKMVSEIFPSAVDIVEMQISQGAHVSGRPNEAKII